MNEKLYIGIDVGAKGFISMQKNGVWQHFSIEDNDLYQLSDIMLRARLDNDSIVCVIEDVHAIFGSSAKATFQFGFNKGYLIGLLTANQIPYVLVQPKEWQREMWGNSDMVVNYKTVTVKGKETTRKEVNTKQTSINACKRLFPNLDLRKSERSKKIDDNKVDSILMSEYARRKNL
jgi:adenylate cyclase class IV